MIEKSETVVEGNTEEYGFLVKRVTTKNFLLGDKIDSATPEY